MVCIAPKQSSQSAEGCRQVRDRQGEGCSHGGLCGDVIPFPIELCKVVFQLHATSGQVLLSILLALPEGRGLPFVVAGGRQISLLIPNLSPLLQVSFDYLMEEHNPIGYVGLLFVSVV